MRSNSTQLRTRTVAKKKKKKKKRKEKVTKSIKSPLTATTTAVTTNVTFLDRIINRLNKYLSPIQCNAFSPCRQQQLMQTKQIKTWHNKRMIDFTIIIWLLHPWLLMEVAVDFRLMGLARVRACVRADCPNPYYKYATYNPLSNSSLLDDDVHDWWWWGGDAWEIKKTIFIFERVLTPSNHRVPSPPPPSPAAVLLLLLFDCLKEDWCFLLWWGIHKFCFLN